MGELMKGKVILSVALLVSLVGFVGCEKEDSKSIANKEQVKNIKLLNNDGANSLELDLYFDSSKNESKGEISKTQLILNKKEVVGNLILNELIKRPAIKSEVSPILPKDVRLLSFSIKDDVAIINLSKEAKIKMTPAKEEACLKGIASSICQLDGINKINILIENQMVDSLGGNYDISKPFVKDEIIEFKKN